MKKKNLILFVLSLLLSANVFPDICEAKIKKDVDKFYETTYVYSMYKSSSFISMGEKAVSFVKVFDKKGNFENYMLSVAVTINKGLKGTLVFDPIAKIKFPDDSILDLELISTEIKDGVFGALYGRYKLSTESVEKMIVADGNFQVLATCSNKEANYASKVHFTSIPPKKFEEWRTIINAKTVNDIK